MVKYTKRMVWTEKKINVYYKRKTMQANQCRVDYRSIDITDPLFSHYVDMIADVVIPYQWEILNDRVEGAVQSHCLQNFRIAGRQIRGSFYGQVFQDSDAYKWLEALSYCLQRGKALQFAAIADQVVDLIESAQQADGYLHTYHIINGLETRWTNLVEAHELYCAGYLIEAAVAYHDATGKDRLLQVAMRFADLICMTFGPADDQLHGYPGHEEIELALIRLYRHTKKQRYLDCARYFLDIRGSKPNYFVAEIAARKGESLYAEFKDYDLAYAQAHQRPVDQRSAEGHAVRALYLYCAMADLALETQDRAYQVACEALWESIEQRRMYITGAVGSSGFLERFTTDYDLPNDRGYGESCASVALMMLGRRMGTLTGRACYHDTVERALFNTVLGGIAADGLHYFYVNPLEVWPKACLPYTSMAHVVPVRRRWFDVACCPTNIARTLAGLGSYIYESRGGSVVVNQLISSTVTVQTRRAEMHLQLEIHNPNRSELSLLCDQDLLVELRLPWYASHPGCSEDGRNREVIVKNGYIQLHLHAGRRVDLQLHVQPQWMSANPLVRADQHRVALQYGPFVYCLEEMDNSQNLSSYGVDITRQPSEKGIVEGLPGSLPMLVYDGWKVEADEAGPLYRKASYVQKQRKVQAIPYCLWGNREKGEMLVFQYLKTV